MQCYSPKKIDEFSWFLPIILYRRNKQRLVNVTQYCTVMNGEQFNVYQGRIGSSVTELQRLEFYVSKMRNLITCYFIFKNQSHYSGVRGQRVNTIRVF